MTTELSGFYSSPSVWGGTYQTAAIWNLDAGVQKKCWQDNATIKLSLSDMFSTMRWSAVSEFGGLYIKAGGQGGAWQLKLNITYRFGSKQVKSARDHNSVLDDLNKRVN